MRFTSGNLLDCVHERLGQALSVLDTDPVVSAPLAAYLSGVAVECAIRAKRKVVSDEINAGHRLRELADEAEYGSRLNAVDFEKLDADLSQLTKAWDNLLRYCSAQEYVEFLVRRGVEIALAERNVRAATVRRMIGDSQMVRLAAETTYKRAVRIVNYGEYFWERRR